MGRARGGGVVDGESGKRRAPMPCATTRGSIAVAETFYRSNGGKPATAVLLLALLVLVGGVLGWVVLSG